MTTHDNAPPHDLDAERRLLGACMIADIFGTVADHVTGDDFYLAQHSLIWTAMCGLDGKGRRVESYNVRRELATTGNIEDAGGVDYVQGLAAVPSGAGAAELAKQIADMASVRRVMAAAQSILHEGQTGEYGSADDYCHRAEAAILAGATRRHTSEARPVSEVVSETIRWTEGIRNGDINPMGLPTGIAPLDDLLGGLHPGDLIVVAGSPSMGKTAAAVGFAASSGAPGILFSGEQPQKQIVLRLLASRANLSVGLLSRPGEWREGADARFVNACRQVSGLPLWIDDRCGLTPSQIRSRARRMVSAHGIRIAVVDYLQICQPSKRSRGQSREQEVAGMIAEFKMMARELFIPVIVVSQMSRGFIARAKAGSKDGGSSVPRPMLSDLKDSGAIEAEADVVIFPWRPDWITRQGGGMGAQPEFEDAEFIIGKHRQGAIGIVPATWCGRRLEWMARDASAPTHTVSVEREPERTVAAPADADAF